MFSPPKGVIKMLRLRLFLSKNDQTQQPVQVALHGFWQKAIWYGTEGNINNPKDGKASGRKCLEVVCACMRYVGKPIFLTFPSKIGAPSISNGVWMEIGD